jgi:hypothetical protein
MSLGLDRVCIAFTGQVASIKAYPYNTPPLLLATKNSQVSREAVLVLKLPEVQLSRMQTNTYSRDSIDSWGNVRPA